MQWKTQGGLALSHFFLAKKNTEKSGDFSTHTCNRHSDHRPQTRSSSILANTCHTSVLRRRVDRRTDQWSDGTSTRKIRTDDSRKFLRESVCYFSEKVQQGKKRICINNETGSLKCAVMCCMKHQSVFITARSHIMYLGIPSVGDRQREWCRRHSNRKRSSSIRLQNEDARKGVRPVEGKNVSQTKP